MTRWEPRCLPDSARRRAALLERIRHYFADQGVLEVDTPALGATGVTDPHVDCMLTMDGAYLQSSPEYFMKRLLAAGYPDIYSISRVFRAAEHGPRHLPEFTMIEWYRRDMQLDEIIADTLALILHTLAQEMNTADVVRIDYATLLAERAGIDAMNSTADELARVANADASLRASLGGDRDAWLDLLIATHIVPKFPARRLTVVQHYLASQASLARLCPSNPAVADRFEIYYGDVELANGYVELTNATEQAQRMQSDNEKRAKLGKQAVSPDEALLAAIGAGLPECAGVALGFERLHMIAENATDIRDIVTFADD